MLIAADQHWARRRPVWLAPPNVFNPDRFEVQPVATAPES